MRSPLAGMGCDEAGGARVERRLRGASNRDYDDQLRGFSSTRNREETRMVQTVGIQALAAVQGFIRRLHRDDRGQDLIEYALLGGLIALAIIGSVLFLQGAI